MFKQDQYILNILLESVSEGVIIVDEHQMIVKANESAKKMFRYDDAQLIKQPLNLLIPQNYHAEHGGHFKDFMKENKRRQRSEA
jgi:PAS domain S-box-containing protein